MNDADTNADAAEVAPGDSTDAGESSAPAKAALRRRIRTARRAAPPDPTRAQTLATSVLTHPVVEGHLTDSGGVAACYVSLPWEPPTSVLRQRLRAAGAEVLLPVADPHGGLTWVLDDGTAGAAWGVPGQPDAPPTPATATEGATRAAVVIVPALAATSDGRRLGQGGGYYDRFLADLPPASEGGPLLVAVVGPGELLPDLPTEPHDRRVDVVIVG